MRKNIVVQELARENQLFAGKVLRAYGLSFRERMIRRQIDTPLVVKRNLTVNEALGRRLHAQKAEVEHALLQGVEGLLVVATREMKMHLRIRAAERHQRIDDTTHGLRLTAAEINVACDEVLKMRELVERLFFERRHFLSAGLEKKSGLRQLHAPLLPREERRAEFLFEILQLPRERRLRQMQLLRRPRDISVAGNGQKIFEYAKFHKHPSCLYYTIFSACPYPFPQDFIRKERMVQAGGIAMEYKDIDKQHILVRLDPGDEIVASLMQVAKEEAIQLAMVQGLGAVKKVIMGVYNVPAQHYQANTLEGAFEMLSLTGTIDTMEEKPYSHFHITVGDEKGLAHGGHLNEAVISATAEIIITKLSGSIDRRKSPETGLNIWKF